MKDSGIEWIGEIPEGWRTINPKALFTQRKDKAQKGERQLTSSQQHGILYQDDYMELTGSKVVTVEKDFDILKHVEAGDFVISMRSFQGGLEYSTKSGAISSAYVMLVPNLELVYPRFYRWLLKSSVYIDALQRTTNMVRDGQAMRYSNFAQVRLFTLPLDEQKSRADFLDLECSSIDKILFKTRSSIEEYKKLKQAVITQAVTKGVRGEREMKDSGIEWVGEIPKEWSVSPMKHFIDILPGYAFSSDDFCIEEGIPLLRGINVGVNEICWDETVRWNHSISKQLESFFLKENDLVVGLDRPWISDGTRVAFIAKKDLPCLLLQRVCRIRTRCNFDIRWIYYWLSGSSFKDSLSTETTGISVPHISTKQIEQFIVAFPNLLEQTQVCNYLDAKCAEIDGLIAKKEQLVKELENYKKSLIYEVVTGKREV